MAPSEVGPAGSGVRFAEAHCPPSIREGTDVTTASDDRAAASAVTQAPATGRDGRPFQRLLAAAIWTGVGIMLSFLGLEWMLKGFGWWAWLLAVPMIALGFVKGRFILDTMAKRNTQRITDRGAEAPWWGFYPIRTWILVAIMMSAGLVLRVAIPDLFFHFNAPDSYYAWIGLVYLAVGVALMHASRIWWAAWRGRAV